MKLGTKNWWQRHGNALRLLTACLLLHASFFTPEHAYASDIASPTGATFEARFAETDRELFHELVKLAKFNIHFHLEANRHQKWRNFTYPLGREAGTALSFSATLMDLKQLIRGLDDPRRISRRALKKAVACGITGNAVSGGASALELAQNTWVMVRAHREGYSPNRSIAFVKDIVAKTDSLLDTRARLAAQEQSDEKRRIINLETKLVQRIRQQLLFEFCTWSAHSRDKAWRENTFFALDSAQNFTRMGAGIIALKAFKQPKLARSSVVCASVANSVATLNPIIRNVAGVAVRKYQERKLARQIPFERPAIPSNAELDALQQKLSVTTDKSWLRNVVALAHRTGNIDVELDRETNEIDRFRQVAQQQSISGPLIGLTGIASSTLATVAVYRYSQDIRTANKLGFAGRTSQLTGLSYALIKTPYTILTGMVKTRRLSKRGELPSQILEERLRRLDGLQ